MTGSILYTALGYKDLIELKRYLEQMFKDNKSRKEVENLIYKFFSAMDDSGRNTAYYKEKFGAMSDAKFKSYFENMFKNEKAFLTLSVVDYENDLTIEEIEAAAKVINIPLFEYVSMPHITMDKEKVIVTKEPVPVGYIPEKRTQQTITLLFRL